MEVSERKKIRNLVLYFAVVCAFFLLFTVFTGTRKQRDVTSASDVAGLDLADGVWRFEDTAFEWYPDMFYTQEDFTNGRTGPPDVVSDAKKRSIHFDTYRLVLPVEKGKVYGISAYSATYAQKVMIDGVVRSKIGNAAASEAAAVPKTDYYTVYFEAKSDTAQIVIWRSDFSHAKGGNLYPVSIGTQEHIVAMEKRMLLSDSLVFGCVVMAFLLFFGIFLFMGKHQHYLMISGTLVLLGIYMLIREHKIIMALFPDLNWDLLHRLEYLVMLGAIALFLLYIDGVFRHAMPKVVRVSMLVLLGILTVFVLTVRSAIYTWSALVIQLLAVGTMLPVAAFSIRAMLKRKGKIREEYILVLTGLAISVTTWVLDIFWYMEATRINVAHVGIIFFIICNTAALAYRLTRTEAELHKMEESRIEMEETNRLLERMNLLKDDFIAKISHEIKTPLTVISSSAQLLKLQLDTGYSKAEAADALEGIASEAQRLGVLAQRLLESSLEKEVVVERERISVGEIVGHLRYISMPILEKNGNRLREEIKALPDVYVNRDMILQVLLNVLVNANRHSRSSDIVIQAFRDRSSDFVIIAVVDCGGGIAPEVLGHVFENHYSGDSGSGLGLSIAKEIVEGHGGKIGIVSEKGNGTTVWFTLPIYKEFDREAAGAAHGGSFTRRKGSAHRGRFSHAENPTQEAAKKRERRH